MVQPANLGFEIAGAAPGFAASWILAGKSSASRVAGFAPTSFPAIDAPNNLAGANWSRNRLTGTANAGVAPDGTSTATLLTETAATGVHGVINSLSRTFTAGRSYLFGARLKQAGQRYAGVAFADSAGYPIFVDLQTGIVTFVGPPSGNVTALSGSVFDEGSGWYRLIIAFSIGTTVTGSLLAIILSDDGTTLSYLGDVSKSILAWGTFVCEGTPKDVEDFESAWGNDGFYFTAAPSTVALYSTSVIVAGFTVEDFERGWSSNETFIYFLSITLEGITETFDSAWGAQPYLFALSSPTVGNADDFESAWGAQPYGHTLSSPTAALFNGVLAIDTEKFEQVVFDHHFTADPGTDVITSFFHGLSNGDRIVVTSTGALPGGLAIDTVYVVTNSMTTTYQLNDVLGNPIDITDTGGVNAIHTASGDPATTWPQSTVIAIP